MIKPYLILIGSGGHAHSCIDVIEAQGSFKIAGLVGMPGERAEKYLDYGYRLFGEDADLAVLAKTYEFALIAIGQMGSANRRIHIFQEAVKLGFKLPTIVASTAHVSRYASIGAGTIVMHGAIINAGASVGSNCIINSNALIEHDTSIKDHCHVSTGALINGGVTVGAGSFIGSGSVIKQGISIGRDCLVGMGLAVRKNLKDQVKYLG